MPGSLNDSAARRIEWFVIEKSLLNFLVHHKNIFLRIWIHSDVQAYVSTEASAVGETQKGRS